MKEYWIYIWEGFVLIVATVVTGSLMAGLIAAGASIIAAMLGMLYQRSLMETKAEDGQN